MITQIILTNFKIVNHINKRVNNLKMNEEYGRIMSVIDFLEGG